MRNKTSLFKRSLAALLSFVMVLGMIPALDFASVALAVEEAEDGENNVQPQDESQTTGPSGDYITLPVTIRDFAADGMLFEYNEVGENDYNEDGEYELKYVVETTNNIAVYRYNGLKWQNNQPLLDFAYVVEYSMATALSTEFNEWWHIIFINEDGTINRVYPKEVEMTDTSIPVNGKAIAAYEGCDNYPFFSGITDNTRINYQFGAVTIDSSYGGDAYVAFTKYKAVYHQADTKGFGLLLTGNVDRINELSTTSSPGKYVGNGNFGSQEAPAPVEITLNSGAKQMGYGITARTDLVAAELDKTTGKPAYTEETVTYLAKYMNQIMNEPWQNEDGSYNSFFVMGTKMFDKSGNYVGPGDPTAEQDLAAMLRQFVGDGGLGDYDTTMAKADTLTDVSECKTWFDAAYYLLHYTWRDNPRGDVGDDGYGMPVSQYDSLHLVAKTQEDGSVYYVFNSGYDNTAYDPANHEIYNTQTESITAAKNSAGVDFYTRGIKLPAARFDPLGSSGTSSTGAAQWLGYGENAGGNTYGDLTGASATQTWDEYYDETNYHLSLEGHAEFVFHYSSDLYFTFTGDDDVYLYINGKRVLDLGGAHSIVKATINLNDVAELCGLKEGEPASFDFFYLERHGTAANFGIETNIQLAQAGMITTKQGYQNGVSTGYDGPVDPSNPVSYSFTLKNAGDATLEHLTFKDEKLGVSLSEHNIDLGKKLVAGLEAMYVYVRNENDAIVRFYSATTTPALTDAVLMKELEDGLPAGYSMTIYNIRYKITDEDWEEGSDTFTNIVNTTAVANGKQVAGTADWKVHKADLVINPFHIYNWVYKDLDDTEWQSRNVSLTKTELIQPALDADAILNVSNADIVLCNGAGLENTALWSKEYTNIIANVTLDKNKDEDDFLVYNSKTPGMVTIYYKIKGIGYNDLIYHFDVITYGVADNVYVLDYGLNVELNCDQYGFRVNDHLTVPQNIHQTTMSMDIRPTADTKWGDFVQSGQNLPIDTSVEYRPKAIIDGCDSMVATIYLRESGNHEGKALKFYGVDMTQSVSTAPANVVYYEENFPGITYVSEGENQWVHYETMAPVMVQATDEEGNLLWGDPVVDEEGNPVLDENGNPVLEPVMVEKMIQAVDEEGNPVYDENGDPVMVVQYESTAGTNQSPDQDSNYGSDPNYEEDKIGEWGEGTLVNPIDPEQEGEVWEGDVTNTTTLELSKDMTLSELQDAAIAGMNDYLGMSGQASNGTFNALEIKETDEVMFFDFVGTGFEIISRTNQDKYAIVMVFVDRIVKDEDGNVTQSTRVANKPVICESKGGDLYQVPIVSITGLDRAQYRVTVRAAAVAGAETKILYIDGIRIYGPLGVDENGKDLALEYYNPEEYCAEIYEVKSLICDHNAVTYADIYEDLERGLILDQETQTTFIEYTGDDDLMVEAIEDPEVYLNLGPNNEIYFAGDYATSVIAFYATPIADYPENARTIEIGVHRKVDSVWGNTGYAVLAYGSTPEAIYNTEYDGTEETLRENEYAVLSGTEQYYTIDVDNLVFKDGTYLVLIGTNGNESGEILALTNLKVAGYEVSLTPTLAASEPATEDEVTDDPMFKAMVGIYNLKKASLEAKVDTTPVNENLIINSVAMKGTTLTYGKTATLTVKATAEAQTIKVFDPDGNEITISKCTRKVSGGVVTFQLQWKVAGERGNGQVYTVRAYDAAGNASVNTETVTVNIR